MKEPEEYGDVTVIVDGAVDEQVEITAPREGTLNKLITKYQLQAEKDGKPTQIFLLWHDHPPLKEDEECSCAQYELDHSPLIQWNTAAQ